MLSYKVFLKRANGSHGEKYKYIESSYVNTETKLNIICPIHGLFKQTPKHHTWNKRGCPECGIQKRTSKLRGSRETFIEKARVIHGVKYDYSIVEYSGNKTNVRIRCINHGIFEQTPSNHLKGCGCPTCRNEKLSKSFRLSYDGFLLRAKSVHGEKYRYTRTDVENNRLKITIECQVHGMFTQTINSHLNGAGCPKCKYSKGELKVEKWLSENKIQFIPQCKFAGLKDRAHLVFDFYLPECNILIEYNGEQHYNSRSIFHKSEADFDDRLKKDKLKSEYALSHNINFITIPYWEFDRVESILFSLVSG